LLDSGNLINQKSGDCLDVVGSDGKGNVATWNCDGGLD